MKTKNPHIGSSFDDFLREEGILEEVEAYALKSVFVVRLTTLMKKRKLTKSQLAERMGTSRAAVDRLLDADNKSVTLDSLNRAARAVGGQLVINLVKA